MQDQRNAPIRVIVVEDDPRYRASLEVLLRHADGFAMACSFAAPADALAMLPARGVATAARTWDLVLMDLDLPGMSGIECTRRMKAALPDVPIVVLTVFEDRATLVEAICAGADGYLLKRTPAHEVLTQLRAVMSGGSPLSAGVARTVLELIRQVNAPRAGRVGSSPAIDLTDRERAVLSCLVQGMSYKAAARELGVSIDTIRSHVRAVYRKLQVNSATEAVSRALRDGLV